MTTEEMITKEALAESLAGKKFTPLEMLGCEVIDEVTDFTGIATIHMTQLNGNVQLAVAPKSDGREMPNQHYIDHIRLKVIGPGLSDRVIPASTSTVRLGDDVMETTSGFTGTVVEQMVYLNGCLRFTVQAKADPKALTDKISAYDFDHARVLVVRSTAPSPSLSIPTGGPGRAVQTTVRKSR